MESKEVSTSKEVKKEKDKKVSKGDIYLDACIFLFDLLGDRPEYIETCKEILKGNGRRKVTSVVTLFEVVHQLMIHETWRTYRIKRKHIARTFIAQSPKVIQELTEVWNILDYLKERHIEVLDVTSDTVKLALDLARTHGLMTYDSIHLATCFEHGIKTMVSSDKHFEGIPGIEVWKP